mgnify:FL=1
MKQTLLCGIITLGWAHMMCGLKYNCIIKCTDRGVLNSSVFTAEFSSGRPTQSTATQNTVTQGSENQSPATQDAAATQNTATEGR